VSIDYVETLQAQGFTIQNPNAVRGCGCGKSFETSESETEGASGGGCGCGGH
jgi:iron-sulfur cluster assembly protein